MQLVRKMQIEQEALDATLKDGNGLGWLEQAEATRQRLRARDRLDKAVIGSSLEDLAFYPKRRA